MSAELEAVRTGRDLYTGMWVRDYFWKVIASGLGLSKRINTSSIRSILRITGDWDITSRENRLFVIIRKHKKEKFLLGSYIWQRESTEPLSY